MSESSGKRSLRSRKKETLCTSCNQSISEAEKLANDRNGTEMICGDCALETIEETIAETKPKKRSPRSKNSVVEIGNSVVKEITTQVPVNATENDQNDANIRATPNNAANTGMQSTQPTQASKLKFELLHSVKLILILLILTIRKEN